MDAPPLLFDHRRRAAHLRRSARRFAEADFLHRRAAENAVDTLSATLRDFRRAVDLSPHPGMFEGALAGTPAEARIGGVETADQPPADAGSADLIVSLLGLHWMNDLPGALVRIRRALRPDGLFLGSLLGGATLTELRQAMTTAELEERGGAQPRVSPFADGFDGAALLQRAGFALPVCDVDRVTVRYDGLAGLVSDLRAMGEINALAGPIRPLTPRILARAAAVYAERFAGPDGRLAATFEIIHLAGWAAHESQQKPARRGSATVRLADVLGVREESGDQAHREDEGRDRLSARQNMGPIYVCDPGGHRDHG